MMKFRKLHQQKTPLIICNVWDVASAQMAEKSNFQAIGTSSAAIAKTLGYADGEDMPFEELEYIVKRIATNTNLPLSVDLESGYSRDPLKIAQHIKRLTKIGVVGINLEDSIIDEKRIFLKAEDFAKTILEIKNQLAKDQIKVFLNIRTDTFLLGHPNAIEESERRISLYEKAGADGIFLPCIIKERDIKTMVESTNLPINVICMPNLPSFEKLKELGIKRISMGNFLFETMYKHHGKTLETVIAQKSFNPIFIKC